MTEDRGDIISPPDNETEDKAEIQEILKEVPDELLIGVLAERLQHEPSGNIGRVIQTVSQQVFSGPIPPPAMLGEYDSVQDGLADRIVSMAEAQQAHRQVLENKSVDAAIKTEGRGQHYALAVSLLIIFGSLYLIDSGKVLSGSLLAGSTLTGLAYIFITGRKKSKPASSETPDPL